MCVIMKLGVSCAAESYFTALKRFAHDIAQMEQLTKLATDAGEVEAILNIRDELLRQRARYVAQTGHNGWVVPG